MPIRNPSGVRRVTRRGKAHWILDFRWLDKDGRQHRVRRDATVQSAAGARAEVERLKVHVLTHGTLEPRATAPTLRTFVEGDFTRLFLPRYRPSTRTRYLALTHQGLLDELGSVRLDEIGPRHVRAFAATLTDRGVTLKGPCNFLRTVLRAAVEVGSIEAMPTLPRLWKPTRKLPDAPEEEGITMLLGHASGWLRVAIALGALAGMRSGEVRALEVRDLDFDAGLVHVRRAFSEDELADTPKSGKERTVPMTPTLRTILGDAVKLKLPTARVIVTERGHTPGRQLLLSRLQVLEAKHGMRTWTFHALRHAFLSRLVRAGASLEAVRLLGGHSDLATTARYVHAVSADLHNAIARLEGN